MEHQKDKDDVLQGSSVRSEGKRRARHQKKPKKKKKKVSIINVILVLILLVGLGIIAYPTFADWWNNFHQSRVIAGYIQKVADMDGKDIDRMWKEAKEYNKRLINKSNRFQLSAEEKKEYNKILDVTGTGIMGYIDIPKIDVNLPIYHGTNESVLQIAIGHIEGSSFPVGGQGSHCAISGHRGLPSAKLFSDIDQLEAGDRFVVQVLDRTLTYEVDQIRIVLPNELQDLAIDVRQDYMTLITCTPYGVNTHRLLVRGHRVANEDDGVRVIADAMQFEPVIVAPLVAAPMLLLLLILMLTNTGSRRRKKQNKALVMEVVRQRDAERKQQAISRRRRRRRVGRSAQQSGHGRSDNHGSGEPPNEE